MMIFFWIIIFAVILALVKETSSSSTGWTFNNRESATGNSLNLLKKRYARGEIEKEEFEERKYILKNSD